MLRPFLRLLCGLLLLTLLSRILSAPLRLLACLFLPRLFCLNLLLLRATLRVLRGLLLGSTLGVLGCLLLLTLLSRILIAPLRVLGRLFLPLLFGQYLLLLRAALRVLRGLLLSPTLCFLRLLVALLLKVSLRRLGRLLSLSFLLDPLHARFGCLLDSR